MVETMSNLKQLKELKIEYLNYISLTTLFKEYICKLNSLEKIEIILDKKFLKKKKSLSLHEVLKNYE